MARHLVTTLLLAAALSVGAESTLAQQLPGLPSAPAPDAAAGQQPAPAAQVDPELQKLQQMLRTPPHILGIAANGTAPSFLRERGFVTTASVAQLCDLVVE